MGGEAASVADSDGLDEGLGDGLVEVVSEVEEAVAQDGLGVGDEGEDQRAVAVTDALDGGVVADPGSDSGADGGSAVTGRARGSERFSAAVDEVPVISAVVAGSDPGLLATEPASDLSILESPGAAEVLVSSPPPGASTGTDRVRPDMVVMLPAAASEPPETAAVALRPFVAPGAPSVPVPSPAPLAALAWHRREAEQSQLTENIDAAAGAQVVANTAATARPAVANAEVPVSIFTSIQDWFQRTFFAASPTFSPQSVSVNIAAGATSESFELGARDADTDSLIYTLEGDTTGTAAGTLNIIGESATYTPPAGWDGVSAYSDTFTVTASEDDSGFHIHGISGLLHMMSFGILGDDGHKATSTVTVNINPTAQPPARDRH